MQLPEAPKSEIETEVLVESKPSRRSSARVQALQETTEPAEPSAVEEAAQGNEEVDVLLDHHFFFMKFLSLDIYDKS